MKRFLCVFCTLLLFVSCITTLSVNAKDEIRGDVNSDGVLDIVDVALTRANIIGSVKLSVKEYASAEMNDDGIVDIIDIVLMRNKIIKGEGDYDLSGMKVSADEVTLNKGAVALIYIETDNPDKLTLKCESDYFETQWGMDLEKDIIAVAIFANDNPPKDTTQTFKLYLEGNENNAKTITVNLKADTGVTDYYNNPGVPDFGTYCGVTPVDVTLDASTYSYSANEIATVYDEEKMVEYFDSFVGVLEDYGFTYQMGYTIDGGGEIAYYVSHDGKIGVEYASVANPEDNTEWQILVAITHVE